MDLLEFYPRPPDLLEYELKALDFLRNDPYIQETHTQFSKDAATYFGKNQSVRGGFEFFSYLDVSHDQNRKAKPNLRLIFAARIECDATTYTNVTYCLCICRTRNLSILRKFHFDITPPGTGKKQAHPQSHMQYGGKMIPQMKKMGIRETQLLPLNSWLSEPRLLSRPMSLPLLLDMALHEFPNWRSERFRALPEWRAIVRQHESLVLRPFFEKTLAVIRDRTRGRPTLGDVFYLS